MASPVASRAALTAAGQQAAEAKPPSLSSSPTTPSLLRNYRFRAFAVRGSQKVALGAVQSVAWDDGGDHGAILTGTLTVTDLAYGMEPQFTLDEGDMIALECDGGGGYVELWRMRVQSPNIALKSRQRTFQLANDLDLLNRSDDDFYFQAGPKTDHPTGWTYDQVVQRVCELYHVSVGPLTVGRYRRKKSWSWRGYSPTRAMEEAINVERQHTGRRFVIRWEKQQLSILPLQRSSALLELGPTLIDAELQSHLPNGENSSGINEGYFASAVTMRGLRNEPRTPDKQGRITQAPKKMQVAKTSPASISKFGYVHRIVWSGDAKTEAELEEEALLYLAAVAKPVKQVVLTLPGNPNVRRGDAIKLAIGDAGLQNQIIWVTEASHQVNGSQFQSVLTVTFDDPYIDKVALKIQSRVSDTQLGAEKIANHLKPKKAKTRASGNPPSTGDVIAVNTREALDRANANLRNEGLG